MGLGDNWATGDDPATPAQKSHATTLAKQLGDDDQQAAAFMEGLSSDDGPTKQVASKFIYYGRKKLGLD